ncbi:MAG: acyltransferase [Candidatus Acidiferrales bacterium]
MLPGTKRSRLNERASVHLDMARGLAAVAVLAGHVRGFFFTPYHELPHHSSGLAALYAVTALGHQAVVVFFVLSGFFIVSSIADSFEKDRWSWRVYLTNRIVRLTLVLAPALVLCWIVDHIGMAMKTTASLYQHTLGFSFAVSIAQLETARNFFGSLFYLQSILVQPFGSDAPLWSLSYEFWYYILFPLALCALAKRFRPPARLVYAVLAVVVVWFIGWTIALYFLIWLLGGAIAVSSSLKWSPVRFARANALALAPMAFALGISVRYPLRSAFWTDAIVAAGFGLWVYCTVEATEKRLPVGYAKLARLLAGFSYTLYLTHLPMVLLLRACIIHGNPWSPDILHLAYGVAIVIGAMIVAYAIAQITEARTAQARNKVLKLLPGRPLPATATS